MMIRYIYLLNLLILNINCVVITTPSTSTYSSSWKENTAVGTVILNPVCTSGTSIVWSLSGTDAGLFNIGQSNTDPTNAVVQIASALDYETKIQLSFQILVTDSSAVTSTVSVTINVLDIFDVAPVFNPTSYSCKIAEESLGECDQTIGVTDVETSHSPADAITCSISGINSNYFDTGNCHVQLNTKIDRDSINSVTSFNNLVLKATDKGGNTATASVSVTITDINDNSPTCIPSTYGMSKAENFAGTIVALACSDLDTGVNAQLSCTTASTQFSASFSASACTVTLGTAIDYDAIVINPIFFTVLISDGGTPNLTTSVSFSITITGIEDNVPTWGVWSPPYTSATTIMVSIPENSAVGTTLFTALAQDADRGVGGTITYSFTSITADNSDSLINSFVIQSTGQVSVQLNNLDFEKYTNIDFAVQATDGTNILSRMARISLTDVNEFSPTFTPASGFYSKTMAEASTSGTAVISIVAVDPDKSHNTVTCSFSSGNDLSVFAISSNAITLNTNLVVDSPTSLPTSYLLILSCTDGGLISTATASVTVSLINNNDPVITLSASTITLPEDQASGQIGSFSVSDADAGDGGVVTCALGVSSIIFSINNCNSFLLQSALDYETKTQHIIVIVATDKGSPARSSSATFTVVVTDVNDNLPTCSVVTASVSIPEAPAPASAVKLYTIPCNDVDTSGGTIAITAGNTNNPFSINVKDLQLVGALDYETITTYTLTITMTEGAIPFRTAVMTVLVNVQPVNEYTPTFTNAATSVPEDLAIGSNVGVSFVAADADTGGHGVVSYTLLSNSDLFSISNSGQLTLIKTLDYETMGTTKYYPVNAKATDGGGLTGTGTYTVSITDVNDNAPQCSTNMFTITIPENTAVSTNVIIITATDNDGTSPNNQIQYQLVSGDTTSSYTISSSSGQISLNSPTNLNYDVQNSYTLKIQARDGNGAGIFSTTCSLVVTITDFNGGTPTFSLATVTQTISESLTIGSNIYKAVASDTDLKQTSTYAINPNVEFGIDQKGQIFLAKVVDYESGIIIYNLVITAIDNGVPPNTGSYSLTVSITDYNEFAPQCAANSLYGSVDENSAVDTSIATLSCTDSDTTRNYIYYTATSPFKMVNAVLTVASSTGLDYETVTSISAVIEVQDNLVPAKTTTVTFLVSLNPINEFPPVFTGITPVYSMYENQTQGYVIATITGTDADKGSNHGIITYSISGTNVASKFLIDSSSGKLVLSNTIDFEKEATVYNILVTGTDGGGKTGTVSITVSVLDSNDNTPVASPNPMSVNVLESASVNSTIIDLTTMITDADSLLNGQTTLAITASTNTNNYFKIVGKSVQINVSPLSAVNYPVVNLQIVITDGGNPSLSSVLQLQVNVLGANQYQPVFTVSSSTVTLPENIAIGFKFYTANATDADGNQPSGTLTWSIDSTTDPNTNFVIQTNTGDIRIFKALDYEVTQQYVFVVIAKDQGSPQKSQSMSITLIVTDINDNDPIFSPSNEFSKSIYENGVPNMLVTTIVATDKDSGLNGQMQYFIVSQNFGTMFQLDPNSGILSTTQSLDREANEYYSILIKVVDLGTPQRSSMQVWSITILDLNDNAPVFGSITPLTVSVSEDKPIGTNITQVTATDKDKGLSGTVFYSLVATDAISNASHFSIDATGLISVAYQLDRETIPTYILAIVAKDGGPNVLSASVTITISLLDVNDNYPTIVGNPYTMSIAENTPVDTLVGSVKATDPDLGLNSLLGYFIISGNIGSAFKIDPLIGTIKVMTAVLDYESIKIYTLLVRVNDSGTPALSSTGTVTISLLDVNDNAPVFASILYSLNTTENLPIGTLVGPPLTATDADSGINAQIKFSMGTNIWNPGLSYFIINSISGQLSVSTSQIDRETTAKFIFTVLATDQGLIPLTGTSTVTVNIIDVNDNAPVQVGDYSNVHLTENVPLGFSVVQINTTDADAGINAVVVYQMNFTTLNGVRANVLFQLNSTTGMISVKSSIDRETDSSLTFYVLALDQAGALTCLTTTILVKIIIDDLNDNSPIFTSSFYNFEIAYNMTNTYSVGTVNATDLDQGVNGTVYYLWSTSAPVFSIDQTTGSITKKATTVLTPDVGYIYTLLAVDGGTPSLSTQTTVRIDTFDPAKYAVQITMNVDNFTQMLPTILNLLSSTLKARHPTNRVGFMYTWTTSSRRRLLAITNTAYYYAVENSNTDTSAGNTLSKTFISNTELLSTWRLDSIGNPTASLLAPSFGNISVISVQPYTPSAGTVTQWYQTDIGISVITLACILFLVFLGLLIGCLIMRKKRSLRVEDSSRHLVKNESKQNVPMVVIPSFTMENQNSAVQKLNSTENAVYNDNNPYNLAPGPNQRNITPVEVSF